MGTNFKQGRYTPKNPDKYIGDLDNIIYRSSWELRFMDFLDNNANVLEWASEPFPIPYVKPTTQKVHRYFPDFLMVFKDKEGNVRREIIEVKPHKQKSRSRSRNPKTKLYEDLTYAINIAKWEAAKQFCEQNNMVFRIVTEGGIYK